MVTPEINDQGELSLEGHVFGSIQGLRFAPAKADGGIAPQELAEAATQLVAAEIEKRAERLAGAPNEEVVLSADGQLRWRGDVVATLAEGDGLYTPRLIVLADEHLAAAGQVNVAERLLLWLRHHINTVLEPVLALEAPAEIEGTSLGLTRRLYENLGLMPRGPVSDEVKALDQDARARLRKLGIKFGAYHIYVPLALKPAPRGLALILFAIKNGGIRQPGASELPHTVLSGRTSIQVDPDIAPRLYEIAGFKLAGRRAVRIDILERLADIIRPLIALDARTHQGDLPPGAAEANGFRATVEMTSLLGTAGEDFASILTALGYRARRTPKATLDLPAAEAAPADTAPMPGAETAPLEAPPADGAPEPPTAIDEVWFPAGRRPDNDPGHQRRRPRSHGAPVGAPAAADDAAPPRPRKNRDWPKPRSEAANPGKDERASLAEKKPAERPVRETRAFKIDPDSPWAKLAALRSPPKD